VGSAGQVVAAKPCDLTRVGSRALISAFSERLRRCHGSPIWGCCAATCWMGIRPRVTSHQPRGNFNLMRLSPLVEECGEPTSWPATGRSADPASGSSRSSALDAIPRSVVGRSFYERPPPLAWRSSPRNPTPTLLITIGPYPIEGERGRGLGHPARYPHLSRQNPTEGIARPT
jgi:hypothetical protein